MNKEIISNINVFKTTSYLSNHDITIRGSITPENIIISPGEYHSAELTGDPDWTLFISCDALFPDFIMSVNENKIMYKPSPNWNVLSDGQEDIYSFYCENNENVYIITYKLFKTSTPPYGGIAMVGTVSTLTSKSQ